MFRVTTRSIAGHNHETRHFGFTQLSCKCCDAQSSRKGTSEINDFIKKFNNGCEERYAALHEARRENVLRKDLEACIELCETAIDTVEILLVLFPCHVGAVSSGFHSRFSNVKVV